MMGSLRSLRKEKRIEEKAWNDELRYLRELPEKVIQLIEWYSKDRSTRVKAIALLFRSSRLCLKDAKDAVDEGIVREHLERITTTKILVNWSLSTFNKYTLGWFNKEYEEAKHKWGH
jgi:hypothetical protein